MKKHISTILLVALLATALVGCGGQEATLTDGVYTGQADGMAPLTVEVTVEDGKISAVEVTDHDETPGFCEEALDQIPVDIVENNSTEVDAVSGVTVTSNAIKDAVNNALEEAK